MLSVQAPRKTETLSKPKPDSPIDMASCESEPIHIPGSIQPHGILFALRENDLTISQVSENVSQFIARSAAELLGKPLTEILAADDLLVLQEVIAADDPKPLSPVRLHLAKFGELLPFDAIIHRHAGILVLELEPLRGASLSVPSFYHSVRQSVRELSTLRTIADASRFTAEQVKLITGFDRVLIYQFNDNWDGNVTAEVREPNMPSFLGLRFPASDIPAQVRDLYLRNWLRIIVDVDYKPAKILPELNEQTGKTLDLSYATLRSVSPVHIEYMKNMKTMSSMSISIIKNQRLWGLISCHHLAPRHVPYQTRAACEFLGQIFSYHLAAIEARSEFDFRASLRAKHLKISEKFADGNIVESLSSGFPSIIDLIECSGAALLIRGSLVLLKNTPSREQVLPLVDWLRLTGEGEFFQSNSLASLYPPAKAFENLASGVLALPISKSRDSFVMWFRPEVAQTINWAGSPDKLVEAETSRLSPRKSFEVWTEKVQGTATPWLPAEIEAAKELRAAIITEELAKLNEDLVHSNKELATSNAELDAFAYIAAHDLKEPVRSIRTYLSFVLEDESAKLSDKSKTRLLSAAHQGERMAGLLNALYLYSKVGRIDLAMTEVDLSKILAEVLARLEPFLDEHKVKVMIETPLPVVICDHVRVSEIFYNLILNAAKYNDKQYKWVAIGCREQRAGTTPQELVYYVKDNGIGIAEPLQKAIFTMFKRLHAQDAFGGGTGTGLTIAKKIIERHDGHIWLESTPGQGTTFFFTLVSSHAEF